MAAPDRRRRGVSPRAPSRSVQRRIRGLLKLLLITALACPTPSTAQQDSIPPVRTLHARAIREGEVELDGRLTDSIWQSVEVATGFTQRDPDDGTPATERTEVRVVYSGHAIYVGVRAFDSEPNRIRSRLVRRDTDNPLSDYLAVYLDSYHDRRTCFQFYVTPRGSIRDAYASNDGGGGDASWNPVWDVATSIDSLGWTAEFRIPFTQLRYDRDGTSWGLQVGRRIERKAETVYWAPYSKEGSGFASRFGVLEGLQGLPAPMRLEVMPYTVASGRLRPEGTGSRYAPSSQTQANAGFDVKYGLTSGFTLDLTVNPDFGQVEADPAVVNLTAFETYFEEKRPFFVEGANLFSRYAPMSQLFYSRRIGRPPLGGASAPPGGTVQIPEASTILGAARVTGKSAGGLGVGVLSALTAAESATLRDSNDDVVGSAPVMPLAHHFAARVEQDFRQGRHTIGGMVTALNRHLGDQFDNLRSAAYLGEVDGRHRWTSNTYAVEWRFAASHIRGTTGAVLAAQRSPFRYFQRPDAEHVRIDTTRTTLSGYALSVEAGKQAGTWRYYGGVGRVSPGFEVSDMGYQRGADWQGAWGGVSFVQSKPRWAFRNFRLALDGSQDWTTGGEATSTWIRPMYFYGTFKNNWSLGINPMAFGLHQFSPTALRGGPGLRNNTWHNTFWNLSTDSRKRVSLGVYGEFGGVAHTPERWFYIGPWFDIRPASFVTASAGFDYSSGRDPQQWVGRWVVADSTHYVVGTIEQQTLNLVLRLDWIFSPDLSVQFYAQPYVSAGRYSDFKDVVAPQADRFEDRYRVFGDQLRCVDGTCEVDLDNDGAPDFSFGQPDFNYRSLRSTMVLRWEYRPGSVLYVGWQHGRSEYVPNPAFDAFSDIRRLFSLESDNTFLVKISYWLGF